MEDIGISQSGQYTWKIDIADTALSKTAKYVLRFKNPANPRDSYDPAARQLPSKGFIIIGASSTTTTNATPSDMTAEPPVTEPLSFVAKVGIGCGAATAGLILIVLSAWVFSAQRKLSSAEREVSSLRLKINSLEAGGTAREMAKEEHAPENHSSSPSLNFGETLNNQPMQVGELPNHMISRPPELPEAPRRYR